MTAADCNKDKGARPATLVKLDSQTYLISGSPRGVLPGHKIDLITTDVRLSLSLFYVHESDVRSIDLHWADGRSPRSSRHFFPFEYKDPYYFENWDADNSVTEWNAAITRNPDARQIGTPVWDADQFIGVQGNEWIMVVPANPSRTVRDVDLPLVWNVTAKFIPLVLTRNLIRRWISQDLWQISPPEVVRISPGKQIWRVDHSVIREECETDQSVLPGGGNSAVQPGGVGGGSGKRGGGQPGGVGGRGGGQPGGVGGSAENTFGCKLTVVESSHLPLGRVLELYLRIGDQGVEIQPPANIQDLLNRKSAGWTILVEPGQPHTPLQSAAVETVKAVREFSKLEEGDPKVLRKLYAWALILASDHPQDVQSKDLREAIAEFSQLAAADLGGLDSEWREQSLRVMNAADALQKQFEAAR